MNGRCGSLQPWHPFPMLRALLVGKPDACGFRVDRAGVIIHACSANITASAPRMQFAPAIYYFLVFELQVPTFWLALAARHRVAHGFCGTFCCWLCRRLVTINASARAPVCTIPENITESGESELRFCI